MSEEKVTSATEKIKTKELSRRTFVKGTMVTGAIAASGLLNCAPALASDAVTVKVNGKVVTGDVPAQIINGRTMVPTRFVTEALGCNVGWDNATRTVTIDSSEFKFPYTKLDPEAARKACYEATLNLKKGCMYGAGYGLISLLKEKVGYPWNTIPVAMFQFGSAGSASSGSLCGALNGASVVMGMIAGFEAAQLVKPLNDWYKITNFPLEEKHPWATAASTQSTCNSINCSDSIAEWEKASAKKFGSDEQKLRCAKLTGDVCAKAVELLNGWIENKKQS